MVPMIERYLLRYFLAVVDNGNFSRAAQQVNVAQPTLSVGITKLETELGVPLFERSSRRVSLTDAGTRLLEYARRIEGDFNEAERSVGDAKTQPIFRLGVLTTIPTQMITTALKRALEIEPESRVEIFEGNERDISNLLSRGRIDAALTLVNRGGQRFNEVPLFEEGYAIAMPASHPLAGQAIISAEDVADNVMIVRRSCDVLSEVSKHFLDRGIRPFFAFRSNNDDRVLGLIAAGLGVTVLPESHTWEGVVLAKLAGFDLKRGIGFAYVSDIQSARIEQSPIGAALLETVSAADCPGLPAGSKR